MTRGSSFGGVIATAAMLLAPAGAQAAAVSGGSTISYTAAAGETNNLVISRDATNYIFADAAGITITPSGGCTSAANIATCPVADAFGIQASLGDMADTAAVADSVTVGQLTSVAVFGGPGADTLTGGKNIPNQLDGDDDFVNTGPDVLVGGDMDDSLIDYGGTNTMTGGLGNDRFFGGTGVDTMTGGPGNDSLSSFQTDGPDSFSGGPGEDSIDFRSRAVGGAISLNDVADDGTGCPGAGCEGDNIGSDVEDIATGDGDDVLVGDGDRNQISTGGGSNTVDGGGGGDTIQGGNGADALQGGDGNDQLFPGAGPDTVDGGPGDDSTSSDFEDEADVYSGGAGFDRLASSNDEIPFSVSIDTDGAADDGIIDPGTDFAKDNVEPDIEGLAGGAGDDTITGNDADNAIEGFGGADVLSSGGGSDEVDGDAGDDLLDGGTGVDTIDGGAGVDALRSRDKSADQVDCGSSGDTLIADRLDDPEPSCEGVSKGLVIAKSAKLDKSGKSATLEVSCPKVEGTDCKAKVKLKANGKPIAAGGAKIPSGKSKDIDLDLAKAPGGGKLHALASASFKDAEGVKVTTTQKVTVG
jgi:Ca2+-binding RTX toxin-like protein